MYEKEIKKYKIIKENCLTEKALYLAWHKHNFRPKKPECAYKHYANVKKFHGSTSKQFMPLA